MDSIDESPFFQFDQYKSTEVNMDSSPAPSVAPATTSTPTPAPASSNTPSGRNQMTSSSAMGAGAPIRNHLNAFVAGWVKRGMLAVWEAKCDPSHSHFSLRFTNKCERPQYPLTWLGEFLISCDIKYHDAPATEAQKHFLYLSEGIKDRELPAATSTDHGNEEAEGEAEGEATEGTQAATTMAMNQTDGAAAEVKTEDVNGTGEQAEVNGIAEKPDEEMADA